MKDEFDAFVELITAELAEDRKAKNQGQSKDSSERVYFDSPEEMIEAVLSEKAGGTWKEPGR